MSPRFSCFVAGLLLSAVNIHAQDAAPAQDAASAQGAPAKEAALPPYSLKNRSKFTGATGNAPRPPFWPIGWVKRKPSEAVQAPVAVVPRVTLDEKSFKVTSILIGSGATPSLAVINGRAYSEGEFLRMPRGTTIPGVKVRVQRISDGSVVLQNADQTMVVPLVRPELAPKKGEEMLLDPDR